jgi:hypothetical protein
MKGTLFSADFVIDGAGDHKLLEINTDTACIANLVSNVDFTGIYTILSDNSITDLQVIYKQFQEPLIARLEAQKPDGVTITKHKEQRDSIFPTSIADASDKFILRMAYDENALLDVLYAKNDSNLLGLFNESGNVSMVIPHAMKQTDHNLTYDLNGPTEPDFAVKPMAPTKSGISFFKLGGSTGSVEDRVNEFTSSIDKNKNIITNYRSDGSDTTKSSRSYQVVYGADLDICFLGEYTMDALFTHTVSLVHDDDKVVNKLPNKHYYEFATNDISDYEGIYYEEKVKIEDGGYHKADEAVIGTIYDSYYVSGSPMTDNGLVLDEWSFDGDTVPSGSHSTSSVLQSNTSVDLVANELRKLTLDDGSIVRLGGANRVLAWDNVTNKTAYVRARDIGVGFKMFEADGVSHKTVSNHDIVILENDSDSKVIELGVEDVDNYIVSASNTIVHNAPCFVAGTLVNMNDGTMKPIEDVKEGDQVVCWDFELNEFTNEKVLVKTETELEEVYELQVDAFGNNININATPDHPFYVTGKGWACKDPALLKEKSGMEAVQLEPGDKIFTGKEDEEGSTEAEVIAVNDVHETWRPTVYNLDNVMKYNNFFVYGMLVHNRYIFSCHTFDSKVEMADGTFKAIGNINVGDKVKSIKDGIVTEGTVTDHLNHITNDVMRVVKTSNGYAEINHPVLVDGKWIAAGELGEHESMFIDNFYNLEIDGNEANSDHNFIVDGLVSSGLGDNAELNAKYQRQPKQLTKHL